MSLFDIFFLAIALAVDAAVVSFSYGLILKKSREKNAFLLALSTGLGQFIMPIIGWLGTNTVSAYLKHFDHWISFLVFLLLGLNVINEAVHDEKNDITQKMLSFKYLFVIAIATSIDACAAGVTLYFVNVSILKTSAIIGMVTFIGSLSAFYISKIMPHISTKKIEIFSGIILIILGFKVLFEHLSY